jgi:anti-anti-sigma factor
LPRCPVCGSARVVVVINRTRGAFCSECGARWAQRGSEQRNVRPFFPSARQARRLPVASPSLRIELFLDGRGIRLSGEVDMENMDRLEKALARLTSGGGDIVMDCAALTFMDSSGFGVLMRAANALGDRGRLILNSPGDLIARTLRLMGIDQVPNIEVQELSPSRGRDPNRSDRVRPRGSSWPRMPTGARGAGSPEPGAPSSTSVP